MQSSSANCFFYIFFFCVCLSYVCVCIFHFYIPSFFYQLLEIYSQPYRNPVSLFLLLLRITSFPLPLLYSVFTSVSLHTTLVPCAVFPVWHGFQTSLLVLIPDDFSFHLEQRYVSPWCSQGGSFNTAWSLDSVTVLCNLRWASRQMHLNKLVYRQKGYLF